MIVIVITNKIKHEGYIAIGNIQISYFLGFILVDCSSGDGIVDVNTLEKKILPMRDIELLVDIGDLRSDLFFNKVAIFWFPLISAITCGESFDRLSYFCVL